MKKLLLILAVLGLASCSLFEKAKKPVIEKASVTAQKAAVKHLGCTTGQAAYDSVEAELNKLLKVKKQKSVSSGSAVVGSICLLAVSPVVDYVLSLGNGKLPEAWKADGCSLNGFEGDASELAAKLCKKI